jgi:hypothetical protein
MVKNGHFDDVWEKREFLTLCQNKSYENAPDRIRTCDLRIRNPLLYPAELRAQIIVVKQLKVGLAYSLFYQTTTILVHFKSKYEHNQLRIVSKTPIMEKAT